MLADVSNTTGKMESSLHKEVSAATVDDYSTRIPSDGPASNFTGATEDPTPAPSASESDTLLESLMDSELWLYYYTTVVNYTTSLSQDIKHRAVDLKLSAEPYLSTLLNYTWGAVMVKPEASSVALVGSMDGDITTEEDSWQRRLLSVAGIILASIFLPYVTYMLLRAIARAAYSWWRQRRAAKPGSAATTSAEVGTHAAIDYKSAGTGGQAYSTRDQSVMVSSGLWRGIAGGDAKDDATSPNTDQAAAAAAEQDQVQPHAATPGTGPALQPPPLQPPGHASDFDFDFDRQDDAPSSPTLNVGGQQDQPPMHTDPPATTSTMAAAAATLRGLFTTSPSPSANTTNTDDSPGPSTSSHGYATKLRRIQRELVRFARSLQPGLRVEDWLAELMIADLIKLYMYCPPSERGAYKKLREHQVQGTQPVVGPVLPPEADRIEGYVGSLDDGDMRGLFAELFGSEREEDRRGWYHRVVGGLAPAGPA